jgi:hypothetical protein
VGRRHLCDGRVVRGGGGVEGQLQEDVSGKRAAQFPPKRRRDPVADLLEDAERRTPVLLGDLLQGPPDGVGDPVVNGIEVAGPRVASERVKVVLQQPDGVQDGGATLGRRLRLGAHEGEHEP